MSKGHGIEEDYQTETSDYKKSISLCCLLKVKKKCIEFWYKNCQIWLSSVIKMSLLLVLVAKREMTCCWRQAGWLQILIIETKIILCPTLDISNKLVVYTLKYLKLNKIVEQP